MVSVQGGGSLSREGVSVEGGGLSWEGGLSGGGAPFGGGGKTYTVKCYIGVYLQFDLDNIPPHPLKNLDFRSAQQPPITST